MITYAEFKKPLQVRSDYDHATALTVPCKTCGATVGELCTGRRAARPNRVLLHHIHMSRRSALWATYTRKRKSQLTTAFTPVRSYRIEIEYCSGVVFTHHHTNSNEAFGEYAQVLAAGLEPERLSPAAKHVRQVTLFKLEDDVETGVKVQSPVFGCEENPAEVTV